MYVFAKLKTKSQVFFFRNALRWNILYFDNEIQNLEVFIKLLKRKILNNLETI